MTMDDLKALAKDIEKAIAMPNSWPFETRSRLAGGWDLAGLHSPQQGRSLWRGPDRLHLDVDPSAHRRLARPARPLGTTSVRDIVKQAARNAGFDGFVGKDFSGGTRCVWARRRIS